MISATIVKQSATLFDGGRIKHAADGGDPVGGKTGATSVLANGVLVRREIDAINFVFRHIAMEPLNLRPDLFQALQGTQ